MSEKIEASAERKRTFDILERLANSSHPELKGHFARGTDGVDVDAVVAALDRTVSEREGFVFPTVLTDDLRDALSTMLWTSGGISAALRADGEEIPTKAEAEQAHVLHWFIRLALEHGSAWKAKVGERLEAISAKAKAKAGEAA